MDKEEYRDKDELLHREEWFIRGKKYEPWDKGEDVRDKYPERFI